MPELPEVETMVRGIRASLLGRKIVAFRRACCLCKPMAIEPEPARISRTIHGEPVTGVRRFAKRVLIELGEAGLFAVEPRMTGLLLLADPPTRSHLRAEWRLAKEESGQRSLWFWDRRGLGTIRFYRPGEFESAVAIRFGPDALAITRRQWRTALASTKRPVKVALLDQSLVAGIGNLYASEILFRAGIHPARPADSLNAAAIAKLAAACRDVLDEAIRQEGSTLADGTYRNALNQNGRYQNAHQVYARERQPCPRCGRPIVRLVQAQRATFLCPRCQRPGRLRSRRKNRILD